MTSYRECLWPQVEYRGRQVCKGGLREYIAASESETNDTKRDCVSCFFIIFTDCQNVFVMKTLRITLFYFLFMNNTRMINEKIALVFLRTIRQLK